MHRGRVSHWVPIQCSSNSTHHAPHNKRQQQPKERQTHSTQTVWSAVCRGSSQGNKALITASRAPHVQLHMSMCSSTHTTPAALLSKHKPRSHLPSPSPLPHPHPPATRCPHLSVSDASACNRLLNSLRMHKQQMHTHNPSATLCHTLAPEQSLLGTLSHPRGITSNGQDTKRVWV